MYRFYENLTKDKGGGKFAMYLETHLKAKVLKGGLQKILWKLRGSPSTGLVREVRRKGRQRDREQE